MSYKPSKIAVMREAIDKVTQILAGRRIQVIQKGMLAKVDYDTKTLLPVAVYLPMLPDDASDDLCDAVEGFLDHEVAHVLFSDPKTLVKASKNFGPEGKSINNMIEDVFIERKMAETFRGSGSNLSRTGEFYLHTFVLPKVEAARKSGNQKDEIAVMLPTILRALGGQSVFQEALKDYSSPATDAIYSLLSDLDGQMSTLADSEAAYALTEIVLDRLKSNSKGGEAGASQKSASKSKGKSQDKSPSEKPEPEPKKEKPEQEEEQESKPEKEKGEDSEPDDEGEGEGEGDDADADDEGDDADDEGDDADDEGDDESKPSPSEQGDESEKSDPMGESGKPEEGDSDDDGSDQTGAVSDEVENSLDDSDEVPETSDSTTSQEGANLDWDQFAAALGAAKDFDESAAEMIGDMALDTVKKHDGYLPFTTDFDEVKVLEVSDKDKSKLIDEFNRIVEAPVLPMVNSIQKTLERVIAARSAATFVGGHRSGRLHGASLTRLTFGDDRVFRRKVENKTKDVVVELVIDFSGSMSGGKVLMATQAAYALAMVLERMRIKNEIIGFTTGRYLMEAEDIEFAEEHEFTYSRTENLIMPIIKTMDESITSEVRARFGAMPRELPMHSNIDGESIEIAAKRLLSRPASRHIMIVLSDGQPAGHTMSGGRDVFRSDLKRRVKKIISSGVDVIGVGIQSYAVNEYYPSNVVINDINQLPTTVVGQLRHLLLQQ